MSSYQVDNQRFNEAVEFVIGQIDDNISSFNSDYPEPASGQDLQYNFTGDPLQEWTPAFWTGMCWLAFEITGDTKYKNIAEAHLGDFEDRLTQGDTLTHDLGFIYILSAWANHHLTGSDRAKQIALRGADKLADRYHSAPGIIQSWGDHRKGMIESTNDRYGMTIVDAMMNLSLLYRAAEETGYERYREIAKSHAQQTANFAVRDDGTTAHCIRFDVETGDFIEAKTHQGYSDESCWSRGQAWTMYGFPISYRYTGHERFLDVSKTVANRFLAELPEDNVPTWDFRASEDPDIRDSSAGAIAVCGLFELIDHLPPGDSDRGKYETAALDILKSLTDNYLTTEGNSNGLLKEGAYNWNTGNVEECTIWGDYYYLEALVRATHDWSPYW